MRLSIFLGESFEDIEQTPDMDNYYKWVLFDRGFSEEFKLK